MYTTVCILYVLLYIYYTWYILQYCIYTVYNCTYTIRILLVYMYNPEYISKCVVQPPLPTHANVSPSLQIGLD